MTVARPMADRFWEKVDKTGECWEWTASCYPNGYGAFAVKKGRIRLAHRVAWGLQHEPLTDRKVCVLHRCDNRKCVNPGHLFLGSAADNTADMESKGRAGWQNGQPRWHKVGEGLAHSILVMLSQGVSQEKVAAHYGLGHSTVSAVALGRTAASRRALGRA